MMIPRFGCSRLTIRDLSPAAAFWHHVDLKQQRSFAHFTGYTT